jgi:hypothetical protein
MQGVTLNRVAVEMYGQYTEQASEYKDFMA